MEDCIDSVHRFNVRPYQSPSDILYRSSITILVFIGSPKRILRKENKVGGIILPDFKLYYTTIVMETVWLKTRHIDQWNRIKSPEINPVYTHSTNLWQGCQRYTMQEKTVSSISSVGKTIHTCAKEWNWALILLHTQ